MILWDHLSLQIPRKRRKKQAGKHISSNYYIQIHLKFIRSKKKEEKRGSKRCEKKESKGKWSGKDIKI